MAFLSNHSRECFKSELNLWSLPPTQTSIEGAQWVSYNPVSSLTDEGPIEFVIPGQGEDYLDLAHTMLSVRVRISNDLVEGENEKVGPVNNLLHSMFNQVDVFFNQKQVSPPNNAYPYRAYIETLLNYGEDAKETHLTTALWATDTAGRMDATPDATAAAEINHGLQKRTAFLAGGKKVDLIGHLHGDVFNQDRFLLNGVEIRVRLIRSKDAFCLMDNTAAKTSSLYIEEATLLMRRVKISPGILLAHANALAKATAKYPLTRVEVRPFTLPSGIHSHTLDNVILGQLPKRLILGFIDNRAFNGSRNLNPFNFQNFDINYLSLYVDGVQVPNRALQPAFTGANELYVEAYQSVFGGSGIHFSNEGNGISREAYPKGYCIFAFDLTPDLSANCPSHWNLIKHGSVRIDVRFGTQLARTVNCIVYAEFDNVLEIDANRQIVTDFGS